MTRFFLNACIVTLVAGCASAPRQDATALAHSDARDAELTPAAETLEVCDPKIVDRRAALSTNCINRVDKSPTAGKQYHAVGREIKGLESMCKYSTLPKCRRKY